MDPGSDVPEADVQLELWSRLCADGLTGMEKSGEGECSLFLGG
jgi:hypothetical protein